MANDPATAMVAELVTIEIHDHSDHRITSRWRSWQDADGDLSDDEMWRIGEEPDEDDDDDDEDDDDWDWDDDEDEDEDDDDEGWN